MHLRNRHRLECPSRPEQAIVDGDGIQWQGWSGRLQEGERRVRIEVLEAEAKMSSGDTLLHSLFSRSPLALSLLPCPDPGLVQCSRRFDEEKENEAPQSINLCLGPAKPPPSPAKSRCRRDA